MGINTEVPQDWNRWWLVMWGVVATALLASAFFLSFHWWAASVVVGFGIPEAISLLKHNDAFPPLTHTIRHFLPSWFAFSFIYFMLGSVGATWLEFPRPFHLGGLFAVLGWLTEHFTVTFAHPDPFPFTREAVRVEPERRRLAL
jgi:hypothetical protein